jgi:hypothetical protein
VNLWKLWLIRGQPLRNIDKLPEGSPLVSIEISGSSIKEFQAENNSYPEPRLIEIVEQWVVESGMLLAAHEEAH